MSCTKSKIIILLVGALSFNFNKIFAELLPGTVIQTNQDKYTFVDNLNEGQLIVTQHEKSPEEFHRTRIFRLSKKEKNTDKAVVIELKPENGQAGLLIVGRDQYFQRQCNATKLKPKLLKYVRRGKKRLLNILLKALWIKAEELKVGDKLVGQDGESLVVTKVELVEFKEKQDFYDISLKYHHVYYLIDTAGNHVLTHNLDPFTLGALIIGGCSLLGVGAGAVYKYKTSKRKDGPKRKEVAKSALIGAALGAVAGIVTVICIYYGPKIKSAYAVTKAFIAKHKTASGISSSIVGGFGWLGKEAYGKDSNKYKSKVHKFD